MAEQAIQLPLLGAMDLDTPYEVWVKGRHSYAENIEFYGNEGNLEAQNTLGNRLASNSYLPNTGTNNTIGAFYDEVKRRIIYFNYNSLANNGIYIFNTINETFQRLVQSNINSSVDFLNFNFSSTNNFNNSIHSVNIIYGEPYNATTDTGGDLLTFVDTNGVPTKINIDRYLAGVYTNITRDYIDLAKAPPVNPIKCVYENDSTVTVNNLTNALYKFIYRFVYDDGEKSVWSASSLVPLPNQAFNISANADPTQNCRIGLFFQTGNKTVRKIEIATQQFKDGVAGTWVLVTSLIKSQLGISDNSYYYYQFYNDGVYIPIDAAEQALLFDYVPIKANNQTLLNGNTLAFSGITEGYDIITPNTNISAQLASSFYNSINGLLFFAQQGGIDAVGSGNYITIYLSGTGANDSSNIVSLFQGSSGSPNVSAGNYVVNITDASGNDLSFSYQQSVVNSDVYVSTILSGISAAAVTNGFTQVSLNENVLVLSYPTQPILKSSGVYTLTSALNLTYTQSSHQYHNTDGSVRNGVLFTFSGNTTNITQTLLGIFSPSLSISRTFGVGYNPSSSTLSAMLTSLYNEVNGIGGVFSASITTDGSTSLPSNSILVYLNEYYSSSSDTINGNCSISGTGIPIAANQVNFAYADTSNYDYGIVYFDSKGRTNGVMYNNGLSINTVKSTANNLQQIVLQISNTAPSWASYYHVVRSNNLTYSKRLFWVSSGSAQDISSYTQNKYAYINIDNIAYYNKSINATEGVVSYDFQKGDRIRFLSRYDQTGTQQTLPASTSNSQYDYEIIGLSQNPIINGIAQVGNWIQIYYPTNDIQTGFGFSGADYQNYSIFIYNIAQHLTQNTQTVFFEFGKQFGINNGYHCGFPQSQTSSKAAIIYTNDGDYFYRQRNVPTLTTYNINNDAMGYSNNYATALILENNSSNDITTTNYVIGHQNNQSASLASGSYPNYSDSNVFYNKSSNPLTVRIRGELSAYSSSAGNTTSLGVYLKLNDSSNNVTVYNIVPPQPITVPNTNYTVNIDATVTIPANQKASLIYSNTTGVTNIYIGGAVLRFDVLNTFTINIVETSFSDVYNISCNSNGRAEVIDPNASQTYYSTLFRYSEPFQLGTNINNTNRFYPNNFDEFDKSFGSVVRLRQNGRELRVYQERKVGVTGVYSKFIKNADGENQLVVTDAIITQNNIQYYDFDGGLGNQPSGLVSVGFVDYIPDPIKGILWRLSQDGGQPISTLFKVQTWSGTNFIQYSNFSANNYANGGYSKIIGVWNNKKDKESSLLVCLQPIASGYSGSTIEFNEKRNAFTTFKDYLPDFMTCAENKLITFKSGNLYIHDSTTYNNFYGTQYQSAITFVCNEGQNFRKEFCNYGYNSNQIWTAPTIGDVQTSLGQKSNIVIQDIEDTGESMYVGAFWGDGQYTDPSSGNYLKGIWATVKFSLISNTFAYLQGVYIKILQSYKNY